MSITTGHNVREYALVLTVAAATAAAGAGAMFMSQRAANAPSTQIVQPVSDAASGVGYPSASTYSPDGSYVIESDRGIIVVGPKTASLQQTSDAASGAGYAQTDQSDVLSRYVANATT